MTSRDRNVVGLGILVAQFAWLSASAEGSFFKDRQNAPAGQHAPAQQPTSEPPSAASAPPTPAPEQMQAPAPALEAPPQVAAPPPPSPTVRRPTDEAPSRTNVSGAVTEVISTDTFVVAGQQVQLAGVRGRAVMLTGLRGWFANNGNQLNCHAVGPRYRCSTPNGKDVGQIVLANGAGEADANAPAEYRSAETQARLAHKGIWSGR